MPASPSTPPAASRDAAHDAAARDDDAHGRTLIPGGWDGEGLLTGLRATGRGGPLSAAAGTDGTDGSETDDGGDPNGRTVQFESSPDGAAGEAGASAPALAAGPPLPVRVVGEEPDADYRPAEVLGRGGSGVVRAAVQVAFGRTVAVKTLRSDSDKGRRPDARARFLAEARVTAGLDHPNIVPVHELAQDEGGTPFLVMKRVVGTPWSESVRTMTRSENLRILAAVADAVAFAHSRGVIHRDIKPENVLLGAFGEVLLTDWGLALTERDRAAAREAQRRAAGDGTDAPKGRLGGGVDATGVAGTPAYMAPEQARGDAESVGPGTDVYLLGATLFEIAAGRRPHRGSSLSECLKSAARNQLNLPPEFRAAVGDDPDADPCEDLLFADPEHEDCDDLERPSDRDRDAADAELVRIARAAMADDPADRPPGVAAFKELLAEFDAHAESAKLTRRGRKLAAEADETGEYAAFGLAARTLQEAVEIWEGNACAKQALRAVRVAFAELACEKGDLKLAESLIETGALHDAPVAARCRDLRDGQEQAAEEKEELEQGVQKWSRAFLASPDCVFLVDMADGRVVEVNDQFTALLGYPPGEVVGNPIDSLPFWPPSPCRDEFVRGLRERGEFDNAEVNFQKADGAPVPVLVSARVTDVGGERMVVTNARDVTAKKRQEAAVRKSEDRLRRTQRLAGLGTWELDVATGAAFWSEETFRIAGLEPAEEPPAFDEYLDTVHPDDRPALLAALDAAGKGAGGGDGEGRFELEVRHRRPDGTFNRVLTRGEPIRDADGAVVELFGSVLDLSGRG